MQEPLREQLQARLEPWGQDHVLAWWDDLDEAGRDRLASQIGAIDLEALPRPDPAPTPTSGSGPAGSCRAEPPPVIRHPGQQGPEASRGAARFAEARAAGEAELAAERVAVLLVAGGEGTRLGHRGPKGTFPIGPLSQRSLFGVVAQQLRRLAIRYGRAPHWAVMTSPSNHAATCATFEAQGHFGLDPSRIRLFPQAEAPSLDRRGRLLLASPGRLLTSPDGHGGAVPALARVGLLDAWRDAGVAHVFHLQVDNPLVPVADPVLIGFRVLEGAEIASKAIRKRAPDERMGSWVRAGAGLAAVEYTEIREPERSARRPADGELVLWAGSNNVHVFDRGLLARVARRVDSALPYHLSPKPLVGLPPGSRSPTPVPIPGFKLERFVFDVHRLTTRAVLVEGLREEEYAPVKNARGPESPATARAAMVARDRRWLEAAGWRLPPAGRVELDLSVFDGPSSLRAAALESLEDAGPAILQSMGDQP